MPAQDNDLVTAGDKRTGEQGADLSGATLAGVDLSGLDLAGVSLAGATPSDLTRVLRDLLRAAHHRHAP